MPAAEDHAMLTSIVADLAEAFGGETFDPHLTLVEDRPVGVDLLAGQLRELAAGITPFFARAERVRTSEAYFRAFYMLFEARGPLLTLKQRAIETIHATPIDAFMPHISLAYGVVQSPRRQEMEDELDRCLAGRLIHFDRLCVVRSAQTIPIAEWAIRESVPLG
jgi:2'-5' RNA ligase